MRLLQCIDCKTVDEIPDYEGPPENDVLLEHVIREKHTDHGEPHRGNLLKVDNLDWAHEKDNILKEMWSAFTGFEPEFYATRSTFQEDAAKCFQQHRRPEVCIDWHSQAKRIGNPVREQFKNPKAAVYLCDFCVVRTNVERAQRGE